MGIGRLGGRLLAAVAVAGAVVVAVPDAGTASPSAPAFADGFKVQAKTTYQLDPAAGAVHVAVDLTITNQKPDQISGGFIRRFYLPSFGVPVLAEAVGLHAQKTDGTVLPVSVEGTDSPRFSVADIDIRPDLYHPSSTTFRLTYDIPKQPPRSDAFTRQNEAYATFPALAIGDPGLADVEVVVPKAFEVELVGDTMAESERDGQQVFAAAGIDDPTAWQVLVSARDDTHLLERTVDVGEEDVRVLGWPDDPAWADFAEDQVTDGVPVLEDLIGLPWPATATVDFIETASPYLYGYGGWYMPIESVIEVGDELDQHVMLHELSHLWFNDDLFEGRWINEAFADELAAQAIGVLGGEVPAPKPIAADDPGRLKLNDWSNPDLQEGVSDDQERFGYNASWRVMRAVVDEIGVERLAEVIGAADAGLVAYRGPGVPEELARRFDWQELLDLLEEVGGSTEAAAIFEAHVVGEADAAPFAARATAREHYAALLDAGKGWAAPTSVRLAMTDWRFDSAERLMTAATGLLEAKADVVEATEGLGVDDHLALQDSYEAGTDLDDVQADADAAVDAADALEDAVDAEGDGAGPLGAIGLLGTGVGDDLDAARHAFDDGDYATTEDKAADVEAALDGAALAGVLRLVVLVLLGGVVFGLLRWRRARRARRSTPVLEPQGAEGVSGPPDGDREVGV